MFAVLLSIQMFHLHLNCWFYCNGFQSMITLINGRPEHGPQQVLSVFRKFFLFFGNNTTQTHFWSIYVLFGLYWIQSNILQILTKKYWRHHIVVTTPQNCIAFHSSLVTVTLFSQHLEWRWDKSLQPTHLWGLVGISFFSSTPYFIYNYVTV